MGINICLLGYGTVGSSVYDLLLTKGGELTELLGQPLNVTHVVIKNQKQPRNLDSTVKVTDDFKTVIESDEIDLVIEAIVGVEPAFTYVKRALESGIPVITANKEMYAHKGRELQELAKACNTEIGYEATVAGGIPIIRTLSDLLHVNKVSKLEGILNGTSNFILSDMRKNLRSFKDALQIAQEEGYAEADPSNDIQGDDAFYKLMILCRDVFGKQPKWEQVNKAGIEAITEKTLHDAAVKGGRIKLVAKAELKKNGEIVASVHPEFVDKAHPLYGVEDVENAVAVHTDLLGVLTLKGPGAGGPPTASAILSDLVCFSKSGCLIDKKKASQSVSA